jgi:hypothetical protein
MAYNRQNRFRACPARREYNNHFFEALYYAAAAGWYYGVRLVDEPQARATGPKRTLEEMAKWPGRAAVP